jgi:hypothetical protein
MMPPLKRFLFLMAVVTLIGSSGGTSANDASFKVVVNPRNPASSISPEFLRNAFLKKEATWSNGQTIRPVDLPADSPVRAQFTRAALKKSLMQFRVYWNQQIFSGKGVPPVEAESIAKAIDYVVANPGALGYLPVDVDAGGAKAVEVR